MKGCEAPTVNLTFILVFWLIRWQISAWRQSNPQQIKPESSPEGSTCSVTFHTVHPPDCVHFHEECASNYAFSLPIFLVCLMPNHPERSEGKPETGKRKKWPKKKRVREAWSEDASTCVPVCPSESYVPELKGNHVSDTHLGLFAALDQPRHAGQNARWDTNASLSCSQNRPATFTGIKKNRRFSLQNLILRKHNNLCFFFLQLQDFFSFCNSELSRISQRPYSNFSPESWRQVWAQDGNILPPQQERKLWHSWAWKKRASGFDLVALTIIPERQGNI